MSWLGGVGGRRTRRSQQNRLLCTIAPNLINKAVAAAEPSLAVISPFLSFLNLRKRANLVFAKSPCVAVRRKIRARSGRNFIKIVVLVITTL